MHKETWSFIETEKDKLRDTATKMAYEATRESRLLGTKPCGVFFGPSATLLKDIKHYGLEKIYFFETLTDLTPEILATYLCPLISQRQPLLILFACTSTGAELGSRVAAKLKKGFISNCVEFELSGGILIARKPLYEGKSYGYFTFRGEPPYIATINEISQEAVKVENAKAPEIVREQYEEPSIKTRFIKSWRLALKELGITEAQVVIGVGGGVEKECMVMIERLAELLEGTIGGTRVAVFKELVSAERQIGATGKFIDADIYIPIGISGSNRHTVGIRNVKHVIPINKNKSAPIFKFAELGIVGDLNKVIEHLIKILEKS